MTHERIPVEGWQDQRGHVERYEWVRQFLRPADVVADIGCGIGYGAYVLKDCQIKYHGFDKEPPAWSLFGDLGDFTVSPLEEADDWFYLYPHVVIMFEVLEHLENPGWAAGMAADRTVREIFVSVPVVPTKHMNEHHLHDFTVDDIPPMFPGWRVADEWAQPREFSHVWRFVRE